jgi:hypothetical protein
MPYTDVILHPGIWLRRPNLNFLRVSSKVTIPACIQESPPAENFAGCAADSRQ